MGIDTGCLRRAVGAQAERAAAHLVDELEGLQIEGVAGAGKQRFDVLEHRRNNQLESVACSSVEEATTQAFDVARPGGQDIGNVLRQEPGRGHAETPGY